MTAEIRRSLKASVGEHLPILVLVTLYVAVGFLLQFVFHVPHLMRIRWTYAFLNYFALGFFAMFFGAQLLRRRARRSSGPLSVRARSGWTDVRREYLSLERITGFLLVFSLMPVFMSTFSRIKQAIPMIRPFSWDAWFMNADRVLHAGRQPWEWLQPVLGHPAATRAVDALYEVWFVLLFSFVLWMSVSSRRTLRMRFFVSAILVWVLPGTFLAIELSSAGPCYYAAVAGGKNPYGPLFAYLARVDGNTFLFSLFNQRGLWSTHVAGLVNWPFAGISAMPSMHVAIAVLFAIVAWNVWRPAGVAMATYALAVQLGSVHLGWHYAVDGYVGALATVPLWWLSGPIVERAFAFQRRERAVPDSIAAGARSSDGIDATEPESGGPLPSFD